MTIYHSYTSPSKVRFAILVIALSALLFGGIIWITRSHSRYTIPQEDQALLSETDYDSIFFANYPIDLFEQADFSTYCGLNTLKIDTRLQSGSEISSYLSAAFASDNPLSDVFIGIDPEILMPTEGTRMIRSWMLPYITRHPKVSFHFLLPCPSLAYWVEKTEAEVAEVLTDYTDFITAVSSFPNVSVYFMGAEHWLIANPANYVNDKTVNASTSLKMLLFTFCDRTHIINSDNLPNYFAPLQEMISAERTSPGVYPDLSSRDIVFFGDSIIGNDPGSFSVPGVVNGLSGARTYNCAQGGIPATTAPESAGSFLSHVDCFLSQDPSVESEGKLFQASLLSFLQEEHSTQKLCFVLNYGLNDYFGGYPVENVNDPLDIATYTGALRTGIRSLKTVYPDADIIVMTPNYISVYDYGTTQLNETSGILTDYVNAALRVAAEENVHCLDNYTGLGINRENVDTYVADGIHLNETGRFLLGEHIIQFISTLN